LKYTTNVLFTFISSVYNNTKGYVMDICCFSTKQATYRSKRKDRFA